MSGGKSKKWEMDAIRLQNQEENMVRKPVILGEGSLQAAKRALCIKTAYTTSK